MIGIYKITSPSGRIYIGQSIDIKYRWSMYNRLRCKSQVYLYNSFKKYGVNEHKFEIICICLQEELNKLEKYYIDLFKTFNTPVGLNIKDGGGRNSKHSDATKIKISISSLGKKKSKKHCESMSKARFGIPNGTLGRKLPEELKKRISEKLKQNPVKYWLGKKRDKTMSDILIENGRKQFSKKVMDTSTGIIYKSMTEMCYKLNYKREHVYAYFARIKKNVKIRDKNKLTLIYID